MGEKIERNTTYWLSYTQPMYVKSEKSYLPDNFRYVEPDIRRVRFGGLVKEPARCVICGRMSKQTYKFLDLDTFQEFNMSRHCFNHPSTKLWPESVTKEQIGKWYDRRDIETSNDPLARMVLFLEGMNYED